MQAQRETEPASMPKLYLAATLAADADAGAVSARVATLAHRKVLQQQAAEGGGGGGRRGA